ncbi:MAG: J domain-containing protein [Pseudomonadota bacterium]
MKDYYKLLGVEKGASPDELKKAFKTQALRTHPDHNPDDAAAEESFKEINEAYAVLSDPQKRREYDQFGANGFHQRYSQEDIFRNFDVGDLGDILGGLGGDVFSRIFGGGGGPRRRQGRGNPFGGGPFGGAPPRRGGDLETEMSVTLDEVLEGGKRRLSLQGPQGVISLDVSIPKGVASGQKLRIPGKGQPSPGGGPAGDLLIRIQVAPHARFRVDGNDLSIAVELPLTLLILGGSTEVPVPGGGVRALKIAAGTRSGARMRIRGFGLPIRNGARGDLYVDLEPLLPRKLTPEQKNLFEKLQETGV